MPPGAELHLMFICLPPVVITEVEILEIWGEKKLSLVSHS